MLYFTLTFTKVLGAPHTIKRKSTLQHFQHSMDFFLSVFASQCICEISTGLQKDERALPREHVNTAKQLLLYCAICCALLSQMNDFCHQKKSLKLQKFQGPLCCCEFFLFFPSSSVVQWGFQFSPNWCRHKSLFPKGGVNSVRGISTGSN